MNRLQEEELGPIEVDISDSGVRDVGIEQRQGRRRHGENLAVLLDAQQVAKVGYSLGDAIEEDLESRREWEQALKEGLLLLGIKEEEKAYPFEGATGIYSPTLMLEVMNFVANARAELLPSEGPVSVIITNQEDAESEARAKRVERFLNIYLTEVAQEFYPDTESALMWCALSGSVFKKTYYDPFLKRPVSPYIHPQEFVVNYGISSLTTASRMTHVLKLTDRELKQRCRQGMYLDIPLTPYEEVGGEISPIQATLNDLSGINPTTVSVEYNKHYELFECHCDLDLEQNNGLSIPYIVTLERESRKVLSIYRNWEEGDKNFKRRDCFTQYSFLPGLGFYGYGLLHVVGGCAQAATSLTRQLMDAGMLANFPGGLRVKGAALEDNNIRVGPTEFVEIETGGLPIDQSIMMMPYKDPSPILLDLKNKFEDNISQFSGMVNQQNADFNPNAPVGTTLALLEQSGRLQSSVLRRLHQALGQEFKLIYRIFSQHFGELEQYFTIGSRRHTVLGSDFRQDLAIIPASDPNVSSTTHRLVLNESLLRFAQQNPELHDMHAIYERIYKEMKIPNIEKILKPLPKAPPPILPLDPITENQHLMMGMPVRVAIWQDHQAHIAVHGALLNDQSQAQNSDEINAHMAEHRALLYQLQMQQALGVELPANPSALDPDLQNQIAQAAYHVVQQQQQHQAEATPPPPIDPSLVMLEDIKVKLKGIEERSKIDAMKMQLDLEKLELERTKLQTDTEWKFKELEGRQAKEEAMVMLKQKELNQKEQEKLQQNIASVPHLGVE